MIDWIKAGENDSKIDVRKDLSHNLDLKQAGTCRWLSDEPEFKNWKSAHFSSAIWYQAGPGSGKTVLCSSLIKLLQDEQQNVIYFFISYNDPIKKSVLTVVRSLSLQLITLLPAIPERLFQIYDTEVAHHVSALHELSTAIKVFQVLLKELPRVHVVVDGLDECDDSSRLQNCLAELVRTKTYGIVKWFLASRNDPAARAIAREACAAEIIAPKDLIQEDIRHYLQTKLGKTSHCVQLWTERSDGNFLWSRLMVGILEGEGLTCEEDIEYELQRFPHTLTGCYLRTLQRLSTRSLPQQQLARLVQPGKTKQSETPADQKKENIHPSCYCPAAFTD